MAYRTSFYCSTITEDFARNGVVSAVLRVRGWICAQACAGPAVLPSVRGQFEASWASWSSWPVENVSEIMLQVGPLFALCAKLGHRDIAGRERYLERESLPQRRGVFHALRRGHRLAPGDAHCVLELWLQGAARRTSPRTDASCMFAMPPLWEGSSSVWGLRARAYAPPESSRLQNPASTLACDRKVSRR